MILVRFRNTSKVCPLDPTTCAVLAGRYAHLDEGQGGITRGDLRERDIEPVGVFAPDIEVFVEGDPEDVLDDTDPETERATRIWWRATVIGGATRGGVA